VNAVVVEVGVVSVVAAIVEVEILTSQVVAVRVEEEVSASHEV